DHRFDHACLLFPIRAIHDLDACANPPLTETFPGRKNGTVRALLRRHEMSLPGPGPVSRLHGCRITLPIALRPASTFSASAVCASGKVRSTCDEILPSAVHLTSFSRLARFFSGLTLVHAPQNTPRISQPLSSARLSGIFGMSPAAKPITRKRPSQAMA